MPNLLFIGDPTSVHDIKWASFFSTKSEFNVHFIGQENEVNKLSKEQLQQLETLQITLEAPIKSYSVWRFWENNYSKKILTEVIENRNIDLVHTLFATPLSLWTNYVKIPSIITTRGSDILVVLDGLRKSEGLRKIHSQILLKQFKNAFLKAGSVTCTSQGQLTKLNEIFGTSISGHIIRTGVNVEEINNTPKEFQFPASFANKKVVFLPRYVQPIYQTELQIEALTILPEKVKRDIAVYLIKGKKTEASYVNSIQDRLDKMGIEYHVQTSLSQHEMWSIFRQSELSIMTPKTDGTPNSALEAMAANCPLILGSFGYDKDLFSEEFCDRLKSDSVENLCKQIRLSLSQYSEKKQENAYANVLKNGNRPTEMTKLKVLYLRLLER